jgi:hypothetical protein
MNEKLRQCNSIRSKLLEHIHAYIPLSFFESNAAFHTILIFSTLIIIISVFSKLHSLTLFSLHPIFMTIGSVLFLGEGIVAYRNNTLLETLSPIMQHNKRSKVIIYNIFRNILYIVVLMNY